MDDVNNDSSSSLESDCNRLNETRVSPQKNSNVNKHSADNDTDLKINVDKEDQSLKRRSISDDESGSGADEKLHKKKKLKLQNSLNQSIEQSESNNKQTKLNNKQTELKMGAEDNLNEVDKYDIKECFVKLNKEDFEKPSIESGNNSEIENNSETENNSESANSEKSSDEKSSNNSNDSSTSSLRKKKLVKKSTQNKKQTNSDSGHSSDSDSESEDNTLLSQNDSQVNKIIPPEEDKKIIKLKKYLHETGIRINNFKVFWENCKNNKQRAQKLLDLLHEKGLKGRPSIKKCHQLRQKLETEKEIAELDTNNIIDSSIFNHSTRSTRSTVQSILHKRDDTIEYKKSNCFRRIQALVDSDSD